MAVIDWPQSPIVDLYETNGPAQDHTHIDWHGGDLTQHFTVGDSVRIYVRMRAGTLVNRKASLKARVESLDTSNVPTVLADVSKQLSDDEQHDIYVTIPIPVVTNIARFRVAVSVLHHHAAHGGTAHFWIDDEKVFTAFVEYFGDYRLDYVPISIVYCPPTLDMTNALTQNRQYVTVATMGDSQLTGTSHEDAVSIRGGVGVGIGELGSVTIGPTDGSGSSESQSIENVSTNSVLFTYEWGSTLLADNQRAIGRAYWGPLGDIFVLLKNPWFSVRGDAQGKLWLGLPKDRNKAAEIVILPAHRLLRPSGDPLAEAIPSHTRRRLLALDPFIVNLDKFFPDDGTTDIAEAADPYQDPSTGGSGPFAGTNRAALIAVYGIGNGVELDLSQRTEISVSDQHTNESTYYSEVAETSGMNANFSVSFFVKFDAGDEEVQTDKQYTRVSYQNSLESREGRIKTAVCRLIRNQNEASLGPLEIWWDKQFSTFMFRKVDPNAVHLSGIVVRLPNHLVQVISGDRVYRTMTDETGNFSFKNLPAGRFRLLVGGQERELTLDPKANHSWIEVTGAKRELDMRRSSLWELADALDITVARAQRIQRHMHASKLDFDENGFERALKQFHLSLSDLKQRAIPKWNPRKPVK
jgi:hypothetical protein